MEIPRLSRRRFLGLTAAAGVAAVLGVPLLKREASLAQERPKARYALIIDTTKCTGCGACIEACRLRNHLPEGSQLHPPHREGESSATPGF
jgi:Na+-translocating ferredoxin:NAD+ oxidoreductase RNF subunit RnfB